MNDIELEKAEIESENRRMKTRNEESVLFGRARRIENIMWYIKSPKGLFSKKCPNDSTRLIKTHVRNPENPFDHMYYLKCPKCDYEYIEHC
jgi:hypothetical protein